MPKYVHSARSFYDEQEIHDVLSCNPPFSKKRLLALNVSRGILLSREDDEKHLVSQTSKLHFSWFQFLELVEFLNSAEKDEKQTMKRVDGQVTTDEIEQAYQTLKTKRSDSKGETYSFKKVEDRAYIEMKYVHKDPTKAKNRQREERTVKVEVFENQEGVTEIIFDENDRASEVTAQLISNIRAERVEQEEIKESEIDFGNIANQYTKTEFFLRLIKNLEGFKNIGVIDVALESVVRPKDDEEDISEEEEELVGDVKRCALSGDDIITTKLYNELSEKGYFISFIRWKAREKTGDERKIIFECGLKRPQDGKNFYFDAKKIFSKDEFGEDGKSSKALIKKDRSRLRRILSKSAYTAFEYVVEPGQ